MNSLFPKNIPIVFLHAHPDDESFLTAGILEHLAKDHTCLLVYCAAALVEGELATQIRQEELHGALDVIGGIEFEVLPFSEPKYLGSGGLSLLSSHIGQITNELLKCIRKRLNSPFILISYDKNGGYGNEDHKIVHFLGRVMAAFEGSSVISLFESTICRERMKSWVADARLRLPVESLPKLEFWSESFGLSINEITYQYDLSDGQCVQKKAMLSKHGSQMSDHEFPLSLSQEDFKIVFGKEYLYKVQQRKFNDLEIERKFLVPSSFTDYLTFPADEIYQGYFTSPLKGLEERIREKSGKYFYTIKYGNGPFRKSDEIEISQTRFNLLWPKTKNRRIHKTRYYIPSQGGRIELDVFHGNCNGLIMAEVEFFSMEEANIFSIPKWFEKEVTSDDEYTNYHLSLKKIDR